MTATAQDLGQLVIVKGNKNSDSDIYKAGDFNVCSLKNEKTHVCCTS